MPTYRLYGFIAAQSEANTTEDAGLAMTPELIEVYSTEDRDEATKILKNGGYIDASEQWVVVQRMTEQTVVAGAQDPASKTSMLTEAPTQNSAAVVDPVSGRVQTDPSVRPIEMTDVTEIAQRSADVPTKRRVDQTTDPLFPRGGQKA